MVVVLLKGIHIGDVDAKGMMGQPVAKAKRAAEASV